MKCKVKSSFDKEIIQLGSVSFVQALHLVENVSYVALQARLLGINLFPETRQIAVLLQKCNILNGR